MSTLTRVKYIGVEEGAFKEEVVLIFSDESGNRIELSVAKEQAEEMWTELEDLVFKGED